MRAAVGRGDYVAAMNLEGFPKRVRSALGPGPLEAAWARCEDGVAMIRLVCHVGDEAARVTARSHARTAIGEVEAMSEQRAQVGPITPFERSRITVLAECEHAINGHDDPVLLDRCDASRRRELLSVVADWMREAEPKA